MCNKNLQCVRWFFWHKKTQLKSGEKPLEKRKLHSRKRNKQKHFFNSNILTGKSCILPDKSEWWQRIKQQYGNEKLASREEIWKYIHIFSERNACCSSPMWLSHVMLWGRHVGFVMNWCRTPKNMYYHDIETMCIQFTLDRPVSKAHSEGMVKFTFLGLVDFPGRSQIILKLPSVSKAVLILDHREVLLRKIRAQLDQRSIFY